MMAEPGGKPWLGPVVYAEPNDVCVLPAENDPGILLYGTMTADGRVFLLDAVSVK